MVTQAKTTETPERLAAIPNPHEVRRLLASNLREAKVLRSLLKLSLRASELRQDREVAHV